MCVFCDIVAGKIPAKKVFEDKDFFGFLDIAPLTKGHTLLVPKKHIANFWELDDKTAGDLFIRVKQLSSQLMKKLGAQRVMLAVLGVDVPHVHIHLVPRYPGDGHGGAINFKVKLNLTPEQMNDIAKKISG
jgi:histidine triad (HIT) family protein